MINHKLWIKLQQTNHFNHSYTFPMTLTTQTALKKHLHNFVLFIHKELF